METTLLSNIKIALYIVYILILCYTIVRILLDTHSTSKTLGYLLLVSMLPLVGIIVYFLFGINYRQGDLNSMGLQVQHKLDDSYRVEVNDRTEELLITHSDEIAHFTPLVHFLHKIGLEYLSQSTFKLLVNGEEKFPEVLKSLELAKHFIHIEYYDWENDTRGNQIKDVLLRKAGEGVKVRILYDDYASRKIKGNIVKELKKGGVEIYPKIKVKFKKFANRVNHRDHRKVIIIDGIVGFVGGINVSDRYDNSIDTGLFWRDTHVKITGPVTLGLQRHFIVSWNTSSADPLSFQPELFPSVNTAPIEGISGLGQIAAGGPVYRHSNIMLTYFRLFSLAKEKLYITNPYFIPNDSILNALKEAAISGVDVRLMLPEKSDSAIVGAAANFYFSELLSSGVRIFLYKKGFVHAKTVVADTRASIVGTANMDLRSFDLNFEIFSVIYGTEFAEQLEGVFLNDLKECREVLAEDWNKISVVKRLTYSLARLVSSFL